MCGQGTMRALGRKMDESNQLRGEVDPCPWLSPLFLSLSPSPLSSSPPLSRSGRGGVDLCLCSPPLFFMLPSPKGLTSHALALLPLPPCPCLCPSHALPPPFPPSPTYIYIYAGRSWSTRCARRWTSSRRTIIIYYK